ncbi:MAG TPA: hypothetical protein VJR70_02975 [Stellaceae bacterium]|nr:hypothetical protein [Stellaceae bacterium]
MPVIALLRTALWAFSTLFGSLGVFFLYISFLRPHFAAEALVFLGAATAIAYFAPQK